MHHSIRHSLQHPLRAYIIPVEHYSRVPQLAHCGFYLLI